MNERIQELAEQAEIKFESHPQHQGVDTAVIIPTDLKKFAELIVQECAGACLHDDWEDPRWGRFYANKIREHFGV